MIWLGGAVAASVLSLAVYLLSGSAIDSVFAQDIAYFRIGAGAPGSTLYDLAGQVAGAISNPPGSRQCDNDGPCGVEGLIGLAQTTADPVEGLQSVEGGTMESAIVSADIADAALQGTGPFKTSGAMANLRAIANVGQLVLHVLVAKEARFQDLKALSGQRIAIGVKDSDNAITARFLLRAAGINPAERLLGPLLSAALDNALRHGDRALTGPVARGDVGTLRTHLRVLAETEPAALPAYRALAERTAQRALAAGLLPQQAAADIGAALAEEKPS